MTEEQIKVMINERSFPHATKEVSLIETHISWVILTDDFVYKIKKPIKFTFLDFSKLQLRKVNCEREVALNQRLAPQMYLDVIPISEAEGSIRIGEPIGTIIDYAVLMKRMDETKQLDLLIEKADVSEEQIIALAEGIAHFHNQAIVIEEGENWEELHAEFADLKSVAEFIAHHLGRSEYRILKESIRLSYEFLNAIKHRIQERNVAGFVVDGHGDLHCRNILLMDPPVIFDCIEFNDEFRKLDLLSEVGFLCMDIERFQRHDLSQTFCNHYFNKVDCLQNTIDEQLLLYYKMYRANVLIKVNALRAKTLNKESPEFTKSLDLIRTYFQLFITCFRELSEFCDYIEDT